MNPNEPQVIHPSTSGPAPNPGPVMDVQRPRPNPAPSQVMPPLDNPMAPADSIANVTPDPGQVVGQAPLQQTVASPPAKKKRTGLIVGIVTTVVVLLIAAGVGGFILYKNSHKPAPAVSQPTSDAGRVDVQEIDTANSQIDQTLNTLNDSTDVTPNDVTDSTLGL